MDLSDDSSNTSPTTKPSSAAASVAKEKEKDDDDVVEILDLSQDDDDTAALPPVHAEKRRLNVEADSDSDDDDDDDDDLSLLIGSPVFRTSSSQKKKSSSSSSIMFPTGKRSTSSSSSSSIGSGKTKGGGGGGSGGTKRKTSAIDKEEAKRQREVLKAQKAEERKRLKEEKERLKQLKAEERAKAKAAKVEAQRREKLIKQSQIHGENQAAGKFAPKEIGVLLESGPFATSDVGMAVRAALTGNMETEESGTGREAGAYVVKVVGGMDGEGVDGAGGCVRWVRKDYLLGGAESAIQSVTSRSAADKNEDDPDLERMDMVAFVFHDPKSFLNLLDRDAEAERRDDYPLLRAWLSQTKSNLRRHWESGSVFCTTHRRRQYQPRHQDEPSRIVLILHDVQAELSRQWNEMGSRRRRRSSSFAATSEEELHDAVAWLLMEHRVECALTASIEETAGYVRSLTRALSEAPYYEEATELHCVKKLRSDREAEDIVTDLDKARDVWTKMLRQVPRISEGKARKLVDAYPTGRTLMDAYDDPNLTVEEKRVLVSTCLTEGRKENSMSECLYRLMTSDDPHELI